MLCSYENARLRQGSTLNSASIVSIGVKNRTLFVSLVVSSAQNMVKSRTMGTRATPHLSPYFSFPLTPIQLTRLSKQKPGRTVVDATGWGFRGTSIPNPRLLQLSTFLFQSFPEPSRLFSTHRKTQS